MSRALWLLVAVIGLGHCAPARAGLYYSGETFADLPSQWRGLLLDQRLLRNITATTSSVPNPARTRYREAAIALEQAGRQRPLSADESADLGALLIRLGETERALDVLRQAQRRHPANFRVLANLGTAWQLQGDLTQAAACLQEATRLAPENLRRAEELHLQLVRQRQREPARTQSLDDLFGVKYGGAGGSYEPGQLAAEERKKLPADATALVQQLALWLPADGRILWQLAELANAFGDVRVAASIMDGCVTEFGMHAPELRSHRQALRSVVEEYTKLTRADLKMTHEAHNRLFKARSPRPLRTRLDQSELPPIRPEGVNTLPWSVLGETVLQAKEKPAFSEHLRQLDGKKVQLSGFMQPLDDDPELAAFLFVEYPIGCWFCEMPDVTGIVMVQLPAGTTTAHQRGLVKVVGTLRLNTNEPEDFLCSLNNASVALAD